jgi:predicted secreted hydrolase
VKRRALLAALPWLALPRAEGKEGAVIYEEVRKDRRLVFPRDYGAHPGFRTEWWYVTGWLERPAAPACGFQITFFRSRTGHADANPSRFAPKQLLFAHAALALPEKGKLIHEERSARTGPGGVRYAETDTALAIADWSLVRDTQSGVYQARIIGRELDFNIRFVPVGAPVPQGQDGYSQKGPRPEQSSHYYSEPQLEVSGRIAAGRGAAQRAWAAGGRAWLDHEWSSTLLDERAAGWDWIGINLDDGGSLMAFRIRTSEGATLWAHAARRGAGGRLLKETADIRWTAKRVWNSPRSQARYPVAAEVVVGSEAWLLEPLMDDQEIDARMSTGGFYWEGAVLASIGGARVGRGYLELTGYAGKLKL